ncbi:hypothetical protein F0U60_36300 [Archangium minus]|uniref:Uncharacterized protein n=1 Tax=Archangium minus TaxID=83450 RepID=A0ABY9X0P5_9BACT|nr:hypothetical protein F0U60_36300 [Archangium minus]
MNPNAAIDASDKRRMLVLAGLVAVPIYVLPVGFWGLRALWPRTLRSAASGLVTLGMLSLVGLSLRGLVRIKAEQPSGAERWKFPFHWPQMSEDEFAASAASGH